MMVTPFDAREITVLISAVFVMACSLRFRRDLMRVPNWRMLSGAMICLIVGGISTVVEHFVFYELFNLLEHFAYFLQSLALASWAYGLPRNAR